MNEHADPEITRAIEGHEVRNKALLARLRDLGASLGERRSIDCHFWAPTREAAGILVEKLLERGFTDLATVPGASDRAWSIEGKLHEAPEFVASVDLTQELVRLAIACSSTYDGWGTRVDEAK